MEPFRIFLGWQYSTGNTFAKGINITEEGDDELFFEYESRNNSRLKNYNRLDASIP